MTALGRIRAALLTIVLASMAAGAAQAQSPGYMKLTAADTLTSRPIYLGVSKSVVIELPRAAGDVLVSDPEVADAVLRTSTRLYLMGVKLGQANVFLFDSAGQQLASFDIFVEADLSSLNQILAEAIPDGYVRADAMNGSIILRGQVSSSSEASRAVDLASRLVPALTASSTVATTNPGGSTSATTENFDNSQGGAGIVNLINITGEDQVTLKVTIAEVQREVVKQLGINLAGVLNKNGFNFGTLAQGLSPIPFGPEVGGAALGFTHGDDSMSATLQALDETNMIRTLAEPTLTAVSGETADFLAGGEFPFRVCVEADNNNFTCSIQFKRFGVQLAFTPVVLSQGRISLKLRTEVSEISNLELAVPALSTRRTETTVELPSGGAFVVSGLVQQNTRTASTGFPGLKQLPVLGALFSSKDFLNRETELVMIVTPYLVKPASPKDLARPDANLALANDAENYFMNRLTRVYGRAKGPATPATGAVGFTFD